MGDRTGRIISTRARVDHVASDHQWLWYLFYVTCLCVWSRHLTRARGGKVQPIFRLFFISLMQAVA